MIASNRLFLTVLIATLFSFSSKSQKTKTEYTDYDHGLYLESIHKWDSAFLMFNRYINNPTDTLKKAIAYRYIGDMQCSLGDLYGAQQSLTGAIQTLDPNNKHHQSELGAVYNILGNVSSHLKLYDEAIHFYNDGLQFLGEDDYRYELMNGKATNLQKQKKYTQAIAIYDSILDLQPSVQSLVARMIDNRAVTKWLLRDDLIVLPEFHKALKIRADSQYYEGLNASYAHLSDYYAKPNPDSALWYAHKMWEQAKANNSPDDILEAMDKIIRLTPSSTLKDKWYNDYKHFSDSIQFTRDTTRNRFALIRYDVQKSKADNLVLKQDITRHRLINIGIAFIALLIITGLYAWYVKRRKRIKQETNDAIRNASLKTSQKVHDVVANGLYGIMNELEHNPTIEKEPLIIRIENLYEKSRNISYEDMVPADAAGYDRQIHELLTAFDNEHTKIIIVGNQPTFWNKISAAQKKQLELVLNEIMVNMKKHSEAKNVVIKFSQDKNTVNIHYKDDGIGFSDQVKYGNGLNNTVSRINSIGGQVIFEKSDKTGACIAISCPL